MIDTYSTYIQEFKFCRLSIEDISPALMKIYETVTGNGVDMDLYFESCKDLYF